MAADSEYDFILTFLGTGTSVGVPVIGCTCAVCRSQDPRNQRTRSSIHLHAAGQDFLVDSGPDLRLQALREGLTRMDAVLYTHSHLDHVVGFDELRAFCWHRETPLPLHARPACMATLQTMFGWAFSPKNHYKGYIKPDPLVIDGPFHYGALTITPLPVEHAMVDTIGFLFETAGAPRTAYLPDVKFIPEETLDQLTEVDILIVDALRSGAHPTHFSVEEALEAIGRTGARRAWLTHVSHDIDHAALEATLPDHVRIAYDGLKICA